MASKPGPKKSSQVATPTEPPNLSMAIVLGQAVLAAYTAYEQGTPPTLNDYTVNASIYVWEVDESVFFGFSASANDGTHNIVAFRGTQTDEEGLFDLYWDQVDCVLPYADGQTYGSVSSSLYDFYGSTDEGWVTSLADSFKQSLSGLDTTLPWYIAGHSLGGAMATLAALDAQVSGSYGGPAPALYTFGSLHVGDLEFVESYGLQVGANAYRYANLCDFVPSLTGEEGADAPDYGHVGEPCTFVWQKWGDWANHSLQDTYLVTLQSYPQVIQYGDLQYPTSAQQPPPV
jgi:triacylglycerol lipase